MSLARLARVYPSDLTAHGLVGPFYTERGEAFYVLRDRILLFSSGALRVVSRAEVRSLTQSLARAESWDRAFPLCSVLTRGVGGYVTAITLLLVLGVVIAGAQGWAFSMSLRLEPLYEVLFGVSMPFFLPLLALVSRRLRGAFHSRRLKAGIPLSRMTLLPLDRESVALLSTLLSSDHPGIRSFAFSCLAETPDFSAGPLRYDARLVATPKE